jgi:hypothetical protein
MFRCYFHENNKLFRLNVLQVLERICREPLGEIKNNGKKEEWEGDKVDIEASGVVPIFLRSV